MFSLRLIPVDFIVLNTEPMTNLHGQIPIILGKPFLVTFSALINYHSSLMKLTFRNMIVDLNIFNLKG